MCGTCGTLSVLYISQVTPVWPGNSHRNGFAVDRDTFFASMDISTSNHTVVFNHAPIDRKVVMSAIIQITAITTR